MAWPKAAPSVCLTLFIVAHEPTVVSVSLVSACADDAGIVCQCLLTDILVSVRQCLFKNTSVSADETDICVPVPI